MQKLLQQLMLALSLVLVVSGVMADAYLDALEGAADSVEIDPATTGRSVGKPSSAVPATSERLKVIDMPLGMDPTGLESYLEEKYIGSYSFYRRLDQAGKDVLFEAYESRPEIGHVRKKIKEIYLQ